MSSSSGLYSEVKARTYICVTVFISLEYTLEAELLGYMVTFMFSFKKIDSIFIILSIYEFLPTCMFMYHVHAWCPRRPEKHVGSLETGVTHNYEPSCGLLRN